MALVIKVKYLVGLATWLSTLSLAGQHSLARTKFLEIAREKLDALEKDRLVLMDEYAEKEEDGTFKKQTDDNGVENFIIPDSKIEEFNVKVSSIFEGDCSIDLPEITTVKDIVCNTEEKITPELSLQYSKWCDAFAQIQA